MCPLQIMSRVMGYMRPASTASEAVTSLGLFGVSKKHRRKHFRGQDRTSKLFSDLNLGGPDDLRSDLRGHPRPQFKKSLFYSFGKHEAREAVEDMGAVEATEVVNATEVIEVVQTTVTEAIWAMEARYVVKLKIEV